MAFNIIAETDKKLDFNKLHTMVYREDLSFDFVPMPGLGVNGGDALGICVPLKNANIQTWETLKPVLQILSRKFKCKVYNLYGGQRLGLFNSASFKKNLLLK